MHQFGVSKSNTEHYTRYTHTKKIIYVIDENVTIGKITGKKSFYVLFLKDRYDVIFMSFFISNVFSSSFHIHQIIRLSAISNRGITLKEEMEKETEKWKRKKKKKKETN